MNFLKHLLQCNKLEIRTFPFKQCLTCGRLRNRDVRHYIFFPRNQYMFYIKEVKGLFEKYLWFVVNFNEDFFSLPGNKLLSLTYAT